MVGFLTLLVTLFLGALLVAAGVQWLGGRRDAVPGADPERVDRLESALASLESRLDALEDQQRFLERLLAERPERPSLGPGQGEAAAESDANSILFDTGEGEEGGR